MSEAIDREIENVFRMRLRKARELALPRAVGEFRDVKKHLDNLCAIFKEELDELERVIPRK